MVDLWPFARAAAERPRAAGPASWRSNARKSLFTPVPCMLADNVKHAYVGKSETYGQQLLLLNSHWEE